MAADVLVWTRAYFESRRHLKASLSSTVASEGRGSSMPRDSARVAETRETHSLEELGASCEQVDPTLKSVVDPAVPLTEFAWAFRYPGDHPMPTVEEARQGLETAQRTVAALVARLPEESLPTSLREQLS